MTSEWMAGCQMREWQNQSLPRSKERMQLLKIDWANSTYVNDPQHVKYIREFASLHCQCEECFQLVQCNHTPEGGSRLKELMENSALHWSRVFEWPWCLMNGELDGEVICLDAGGGHSVFQYLASRYSKTYVNIDLNKKSLEAVKVMRNRLNLPINTKERNLLDTEFVDNVFDRVFCISVLEHSPQWQFIIQELVRVTKPGGLLLITMDVVKDLRNAKYAGDFAVFFDSIRDWLKKTFKYLLIPPTSALHTTDLEYPLLNCLCLKIRK